MSARPLRLVSEMTPEADLQASVMDALELLLLPPAYWCAMPLGHIKLTKQQGAKLTRMGARTGLPDLFVFHGRATFGIELKRQGGQLSRTRYRRNARGALVEIPGQVEVFPKLIDAGLRIAVCHSVPEVLHALQDFGVPLRRAAA